MEFDLDLPVANSSQVKALPETATIQLPKYDPSAWHGYRVLVVEDHPVNQDLIRWRMRQLGLECELVGNGEAALNALQHFRYNLVITDCRMSGMDGYTLAGVIRQRESETGAPRMPIIALTASAMPDEVERCHTAGMDDVMTKPITLNTMSNTIARWLPRGEGYIRVMLVENGISPPYPRLT